MRVFRLQAEGYKRLVAVDITPEGDLIEVRGDNGNGKSSVLDAIYSALGGAAAAPEMPVREGEEAAVIRLDLGELIVTRYFTAQGTTALKVTNAEGAVYPSGQTMLDGLVGHIAFDPLEFLDKKPAEQAEELRKLVDIIDPATGEVLDLAKLEAKRVELYNERRDVNRDGGSLKSRIEALGGVAFVPDEVPDREAILASLSTAAETNAAIERDKAARGTKQSSISAAKEREQGHRDRIEKLRSELEEAEKAANAEAEYATNTEAELAALPELGEPVDVADLNEQLKTADNIAGNIRHNAEREKLMGEFETLKTKSGDLTQAMADIATMRATAIAAATMPVEGLELKIDDDGALGVYFDGVPFSQASDAQQLRVSAAVAMAANPKLRVLRLKNGSLLDKKAVEALRALATENDFQIWAEFVGDEGPGIIMEAGEVRGAEKPDPLPKPRTRKKAGDESAADEAESGGNQRSEGGVESVSHETKAADMPADGLFATAQGEIEAPAKPRPQAMREFTTKPQGEQS